MDAKEYFIKANAICREFEKANCRECPLFNNDCGNPQRDEDIDKTIALVENYTIKS